MNGTAHAMAALTAHEMRAPLLVVLDGHHPDARALGGKAAALDRLVAIGLPVPRCAVLTTTAYRLSTVDGALRDAIDRLRTSPIPPPERHDAARRAVDDVFLRAHLPPAVTAAIAHLAACADDPAACRLAVRSSATAEDLDAASFAGQYRSVLDVQPDGIERAVRLTWASLWHPAPRTYRAYRGIGDDVEMAVLATPMIDPVLAGVLFTRDPTGSGDDLRLEWVEGLGELLVSGARTPTATVLPRADAAARASDLDPAPGDRLGDRLAELVTAGLDLERRLGRPQDVEWAIDGARRLWLLQARPITGPGSAYAGAAALRADRLDDGFDVRPPGRPALTTAGIGEMLPGVVPPLVWSATSRQVEDGFRNLFADLGAPLDGLERPHALVARVHGRAALDLDRMRAAAASIPGGSADELERRYFGDVLSTDADDVRAPARRAGPVQGARLLLDRHRAVVESEIVTRAVDLVHTAEPALGGTADGALLALRARVLDLAERTTSAEISVAALAAAAFRGVEAFVGEHVVDAATLTQRATAPGRPGTGGTPPTLPLHELDEAGLRALRTLDVAGLDWPDARARLLGTLAGRAALARWEALLARSGSTALFAGPTWADAPDLAWLTLRAHLARASPGSAAPAAPRARTDELVAAIAASGHRVGPARRRFLRREVDDARELLDRRQRTKSAVLVLGGVARRIDDEIGRRLVDRRRLERVDDVRLLTGAEVAALLRGATSPSWSVVALRRDRHAAAVATGPLPRLFRGDPDAPIDRRPGPGDLGATGRDGARTGWAASPGWYEGPARVVTSPSSGAIRPGEVLVARATDASWAPLFLVAGAIVVEDGGPLSHAAIIARELGVPAVVNLPGVVDEVTRAGAGAQLAVDGTNGTVVLHRGHPCDDLALVPIRTAPEPVDPNRLGVFVTGLIGAGALLSALVSVTEAIGSERGARRAGRRAAGAATNAAELVLHGTERAARGRAGLRSAGWYAAAGVLSVAVATLVLAGTMRGWLDAEGDTGPWSALWLAAGLTGALPLAAAGAAMLRAADRWPEVPVLVRRHLGAAAPDGSPWSQLPQAHRRVIVGLATVATALTALALLAEGALLAIDRPIYDAMGASRDADPWGPGWFSMYFGRPQVAIPIALAVALFTLRCRVLALAYPLAIVFGGLANMGIGRLVGRQRPPLSDHWYQWDSFPSGHAIEVTLLLGLAPLAGAVLLRRRWVGRAVRVVASAVLAVMLVDGVRDGSHWLSDYVAGFCLALAAVVLVHALARTPALHATCHECPAMAIAPAATDREASP